MKRFMIFVLLSLSLIVACKSKEPQRMAVEGMEAPNFTLSGLDGEKTTLSSLRGKLVLVNFWATWCPPCRSEVPSMAALNRIMEGKQFRMLAISIDEGGKEAVTRFFKSAGVSLPTLLDSDGRTSSMYGITGVPETFVINGKGVIIKKIVGPLDWSSPEVVRFLDDALTKG